MVPVCADVVIAALLSLPGQAPPAPVSLSFADLTRMSWHELEAVYRAAAPGDVPSGFVRGRTVYNPCAPLPGPRTHLANAVWKGKHFCPEQATLVNQFAGVRAIRAEIYPGQSLLDGGPAHILDYADTSLIWRSVRDEMREVAPGLYVGAMYIRDCPHPRLKTLFILEACSCTPARGAP